MKRDHQGNIIPGTHEPGDEAEAIAGSAFGALPTTPFTPDLSKPGAQRPEQPGEHPKQAVDTNQPVYANPQAYQQNMSDLPSEKLRVERELNAGSGIPESQTPDGRPFQSNEAAEGSGLHQAAAGMPDPAATPPDQETEEARRLREEAAAHQAESDQPSH